MVIHKNNLHFLRFLLATLVIVGHAYALTDPGNTHHYRGHYVFSSLTALSVNAFFIISGYLIYHSLMHTGTYRQYLTNRLLRIVPLFYIVIILTVLACSFFFVPVQDRPYWQQTGTWDYLLNNLTIFRLTHTIPGVFISNPEPLVNGSLWSIPYEIICYLCFSALFLFRDCSRQKDLIMIAGYIACTAVYLSVHVFHLLPGSGVTDTLTRCLLLFFTGMMTARFLPPAGISPLTALLCFLAFAGLYYFRQHLFYEDLYMLFVFPFSLFIMYIAFVPNRLLPRFAKLGDASYGIYLTGFPVQQMLISHFPGWHPLANAAATCLIVVPLAFASWHYIEKPILSLKYRVK